MINNNQTSHLSVGSHSSIDIDSNQTIAQLKANPNLFWEFWQTQEKDVFNYCFYRLTENFHDAEDLCSDTMLKAYEKLPDANPDVKVFGWLLQLARHSYFDQIRKKQTHFKYKTLTVEDESSGSNELFDQAFNEKILQFTVKAINKTPQKYRVIAFDYFFNDKNYKQISVDHNQSESHIRKLIFRTRKQITPAIFKFIQK